MVLVIFMLYCLFIESSIFLKQEIKAFIPDFDVNVRCRQESTTLSYTTKQLVLVTHWPAICFWLSLILNFFVWASTIIFLILSSPCHQNFHRPITICKHWIMPHSECMHDCVCVYACGGADVEWSAGVLVCIQNSKCDGCGREWTLCCWWEIFEWGELVECLVCLATECHKRLREEQLTQRGKQN